MQNTVTLMQKSLHFWCEKHCSLDAKNTALAVTEITALLVTVYTERSSALQPVTHKVNWPCGVRLWRYYERALDACREPFLQLAALLVMHLFIYSVHLLVVPGLAVTTKSLEDLPEAVIELCRLADSLLHFTVILLFSVIEIWPVDIHQFARPRDAHFVFLYDLIG